MPEGAAPLKSLRAASIEVVEYDDSESVAAHAMATTTNLLEPGATATGETGKPLDQLYDPTGVVATTSVKLGAAFSQGNGDTARIASLREAANRSMACWTSVYNGKVTEVKQHGRWFTDEKGRVCVLRGVNLSGATKTPATPCQYSQIEEGFYNHRAVSFVGRPFPLVDADVHFLRLRRWGFNFLRFLVTWEAIEHAGPGIYDDEYIEYVAAVLEKAKFYGFKVFVDPHQDVWSRFSGGSGVPGWTLEVAGLDMTKFHESQAAIVQNTFPGPKKQYPKMVWATNYQKLAAATMFTLFFAGKAFAPKTMVDGQNIQDYLQSHYINSIKRVAARVKSIGVVLGYDTLNEPARGYLGLKDLRGEWPTEFKLGAAPTPIQTMLLGVGFSFPVAQFKFTSVGSRKLSSTLLANPNKVSSWLPGKPCIWAEHGVYDPKTGECLRPSYFANVTPDSNVPMDWVEHYWKPFANRFGHGLREAHQDCIIFLEPPVNEPPPRIHPSDRSAFPTSPESSPEASELTAPVSHGDLAGPLCYAPHWYDGLTLTSKNFSTMFNVDFVGYTRQHYSNLVFAIYWGESNIRRCFARMLRVMKQEGLDLIGEFPCLIGEIGIPYDMNEKEAYKTGDYSKQIKAMDCSLSSVDANLLNATIWTYVADNSHEWGDNWNGEDLSIWSKSDAALSPPYSGVPSGIPIPESCQADGSWSGTFEDLDRGGRALDAVVRPFARRISGVPTKMQFSMLPSTDKPNKKLFVLEYVDQTGKAAAEGAETEIYLPMRHFPLSPSGNGAGSPANAMYKVNSISPDGLSDDAGGNQSTARLRSDTSASQASDNPIYRGEASDVEPAWTVQIEVSDGSFAYLEGEQILLYRHGSGDVNGVPGLHRITVTAVIERKGCC